MADQPQRKELTLITGRSKCHHLAPVIQVTELLVERPNTRGLLMRCNVEYRVFLRKHYCQTYLPWVHYLCAENIGARVTSKVISQETFERIWTAGHSLDTWPDVSFLRVKEVVVGGGSEVLLWKRPHLTPKPMYCGAYVLGHIISHAWVALGQRTWNTPK